jgi:chemotaxis methyl-accepting protein methylase
VTAASERLSGREHVVVERSTLPEEMPEGPFDLIVASEILYYYTREQMLATLQVFERELARGGVLLAVHWRRETRTYPLQGDEVHELLLEHTRLHNEVTIYEPDYRLDLFEDPA